MVERLTCNEDVAGSNPVGGSKKGENMSEQKELQELFQLIEDLRGELLQKVGELAAKIVPGETLKESQKVLEKKVEHLKQLVAEYKEYKDPLFVQDNIRNLQGMGDRFAIDIADIKKKFKAFESKAWLRILSDEEIKEQYLLAGKPSLSKIGKDFKVTPENAWNYTNAIVKDPVIRWEFFRYCGGA